MTGRSVNDLAADMGREGMVTVYDHEGKYAGCMGARMWEWLQAHPELGATALAELVSRLETAEAQVAALTQERDVAWDKARNERRLVDEWTAEAATERECREAAEAALADTRRALEASALGYHKSNSHPRDFTICTWPQCRKARRALAAADSTGDTT